MLNWWLPENVSTYGADIDWLFHLMKEAESAPQLCGLSIDALGEIDDQHSTRHRKVVREIWKVSSVDVVTRPSAGGQVAPYVAPDPRSAASAASVS